MLKKEHYLIRFLDQIIFFKYRPKLQKQIRKLLNWIVLYLKNNFIDLLKIKLSY